MNFRIGQTECRLILSLFLAHSCWWYLTFCNCLMTSNYFFTPARIAKRIFLYQWIRSPGGRCNWPSPVNSLCTLYNGFAWRIHFLFFQILDFLELFYLFLTSSIIALEIWNVYVGLSFYSYIYHMLTLLIWKGWLANSTPSPSPIILYTNLTWFNSCLEGCKKWGWFWIWIFKVGGGGLGMIYTIPLKFMFQNTKSNFYKTRSERRES